MLPLLAIAGVLALGAGAATASAKSSAQITTQDVISRVQNGLKCLSSWHSLYQADGTTQFKSVVGCVLYAAEGGQFGTPAPVTPVPTITSAVQRTVDCEVIVTGTGLAGASVTWNGFSNMSLDSDSATEIDFQVGTQAAGTTVSLTTAGGSASAVIVGSGCGDGAP
jgi:hypothetical protein